MHTKYKNQLEPLDMIQYESVSQQAWELGIISSVKLQTLSPWTKNYNENKL